MIVNQVNVIHASTFDAEDDASVSGNSYRPEPGKITFELMQPVAWQVHVVSRYGGYFLMTDFEDSRRATVRYQLQDRGVSDPQVLAAMGKVRRDAFAPAAERDFAYSDGPLPIGHGQTISQPLIVALMTEALKHAGGERVLEIGTGSGYAAAVLAEIATEVFYDRENCHCPRIAISAPCPSG